MDSKVHILISGHSGSGKTTVSEIIVRALEEAGIEVVLHEIELAEQEAAIAYREVRLKSVQGRLSVFVESAGIRR